MKVTALDSVTIDASGHLRIRVVQQIASDGVTVTCGAYSAYLLCGTDIDAQLAAMNEQIEKDGFPPINDADIEAVKSHSTIAATPEKVAAYQATVATMEGLQEQKSVA